jgi:hypothetical protein
VKDFSWLALYLFRTPQALPLALGYHKSAVYILPKHGSNRDHIVIRREAVQSGIKKFVRRARDAGRTRHDFRTDFLDSVASYVANSFAAMLAPSKCTAKRR